MIIFHIKSSILRFISTLVQYYISGDNMRRVAGILIADNIMVEDTDTIIVIPGGVRIRVEGLKIDVPEECKPPLLVSIFEDGIQISRIAGSCTIYIPMEKTG